MTQPASSQGCTPNLQDQSDVVNILSAIIPCERGVWEHISARLATLVLAEENGRPLFVRPEVVANAEHVAAIREDVERWYLNFPALGGPGAAPEVAAGDPAAVREALERSGPRTTEDIRRSTVRMAELYFVYGDPAPPEALTSRRITRESLDPADEKRQRLKPALLTGTRSWRNRISWVGHVEHVHDFLTQAAEAAHTILAETRMPREIAAGILARERQETVPGVNGVGGGARVAATGDQEFLEMYTRGGASGYIRGQTPAGPRQAPYTLKLEDTVDHTGQRTTNVAVYDTYERPPYIRRFPLNTTRGDVAFTHAPGRWNLVLSVTAAENGDLNVALRHADDSAGQHAIRTTANTLARARLDQAVGRGTGSAWRPRISRIGGEEFYLMPQGGANGMMLFYRRDLADSPEAGWQQLTPTFAAVISRVGPNGTFQKVDGTPHLGEVNGQPYRLEWDAATRSWIPRAGQGTFPPNPNPPASTTAGSSDAPASSTGTASGEASQSGAAPAGAQAQQQGQQAPVEPIRTGNETCDRLIALAAGDAGWRLDAEAEAGLSEEHKRNCYRVASVEQNGQKIYVMFTPNDVVRGNHVTFGGITDFRVAGHFIVYHLDTRQADGTTKPYAVYEDFLRGRPEEGQSENTRFVVAADVPDRGTAQASLRTVLPSATQGGPPTAYWQRDFDLVRDAFKRYLDYSDAEIATIVGNIQRLAGNNEFTISQADKDSATIEVRGRGTFQVWPEARAANSTGAPADNPQTEGPAGSLVMDMARGRDLSLPETLPFTSQAAGANQTLRRASMYGGTAIYQLRSDNPAHQEWYLMMRYKEGNARHRAGPELIFTTRGGDQQLSAPGRVVGRDHSNTNVDGGVAHLVLVPGSTQQRGAYMLFSFPPAQDQPINQQHCLGHVIYWGDVSAEQVREAGCVRGRW